MKKQKIILDVDPGVDDAVAMIYAYLCGKFDVKLVSVVAGNVGIEQTTKNALFVTEKFSPVPVKVVSGFSCSILGTDFPRLSVHGEKGLGGMAKIGKTKLKTINTPTYGVCEAIRDTVMQNKGEITIMGLGPFTNIALTLQKYPEIKPFIKQLLLMGGSIDGTGSVTPYAGFNVYSDPEACEILVKSKIPILFSPKEIGINTFITQPELDKFESFGECGKFVSKLYSGYRDLLLPNDKFATHDLCAVMALAKPEIFSTKNVSVKVNVKSPKKRGQTIFKDLPESNIALYYDASATKIVKELERVLKKAD